MKLIRRKSAKKINVPLLFFCGCPAIRLNSFFFLFFFWWSVSNPRRFRTGIRAKRKKRKAIPRNSLFFLCVYWPLPSPLPCLSLSPVLRIWLDADRSLAGKRAYQEESPEHLKYPRMLLPNPLSQNTSGRGNDVRARDPIGEILLVQNHQRNLISSFLPSVFLQIRPFCQAQHWDRWFLKKKRVPSSWLAELLLAVCGQMPEMGGRKKEKKE